MKNQMTDREFEKINTTVEGWAKKIRPMLVRSARQFTRGKRSGFVIRSAKKELPITKIGSSIKKSFGIAESVGFSIARHGVFVSKGVGRGYQMSGGMVMRVSKTPTQGPTRKPVDWFNPIIERHVPELADKIAEINADLALNAARMRIK